MHKVFIYEFLRTFFPSFEKWGHGKYTIYFPNAARSEEKDGPNAELLIKGNHLSDSLTFNWVHISCRTHMGIIFED